MKNGLLLVALLIFQAWILSGQAHAGPYAEWSLDSGVSGSGTFAGESGMPDFTFVLSGGLTPSETEIDADDPFDHAPWEALFGDGDNRESLRFGSPAVVLTTSTVTISFDSPADPTQPWGFAVTDLEGEDAIIGASLDGVAVADGVVAGWFGDLFDSQPSTTGSPHLPSGFDAAAVAVIAEFDPDGALSDELLAAEGTESASAWFAPETPIDTLTITYRNRFNDGGASSMHVYLAVAVIPMTSISCPPYSTRRPRAPPPGQIRRASVSLMRITLESCAPKSRPSRSGTRIVRR